LAVTRYFVLHHAHRHLSTNNIIISERDLFDFRSGEPPEKYLTVLRALDVCLPGFLPLFPQFIWSAIDI
jgi:hypothetical protein